ncbi:hypothetical protein [Pseudoroseicyclus tamaricis]|uniref:hypothetical protein n=1 Tax=Pseudoroseicyclus tamaricis TaxID=2705421 RepID=UPI0014330CC4|nr:hypothetical protein [Pseudoroseicyclus tamaricis]
MKTLAISLVSVVIGGLAVVLFTPIFGPMLAPSANVSWTVVDEFLIPNAEYEDFSHILSISLLNSGKLTGRDLEIYLSEEADSVIFRNEIPYERSVGTEGTIISLPAIAPRSLTRFSVVSSTPNSVVSVLTAGSVAPFDTDADHLPPPSRFPALAVFLMTLSAATAWFAFYSGARRGGIVAEVRNTSAIPPNRSTERRTNREPDASPQEDEK